MPRDNSGDDPVTIAENAKVKHDTEKAVLYEIDGEQKWIPKSALHDDCEVFEAHHPDGAVVVKKWWAEKNGYEV